MQKRKRLRLNQPQKPKRPRSSNRKRSDPGLCCAYRDRPGRHQDRRRRHEQRWRNHPSTQVRHPSQWLQRHPPGHQVNAGDPWSRGLHPVQHRHRTPGSISPSRGVLRNSNSVCLNDRHLQQDLEQLLQRPIRIANDADCFTLSEAIDGAATGAKSVFGVSSVPAPAGVLWSTESWSPAQRSSREWGHNPLPRPTREEMPGPDATAAGAAASKPSSPARDWPGTTPYSREKHLPPKRSPGLHRREIVQRSKPSAPTKTASPGDWPASSMSWDPEVIVLGGGLSNIQRLYHNVPRQWEQYVFSDSVTTRLVPPHHGDSSGVRAQPGSGPTHPESKHKSTTLPRGDEGICLVYLSTLSFV